MKCHKDIAASFLPIHKLTIDIKGQGVTEPGPGTYAYDVGARVTVSALPASGWRLDRWYGALSGSASTRVIAMNCNKKITACFSAHGRKLTIVVKGKGITEPGPGVYTYAPGARVTVSALPAAGWSLDRWYGAPSGNTSSRVITMNYNKNITATFLPVCELTIDTKGQGATEPGPGVYTYDRGTRVTVSALPASGWRLDRWYGALSGSASTRVINMNGNKRITACFNAQYRFETEVEPAPSYIANRNSREIHRPDCYSVTRMKETNKMPLNNLAEVAELIRDMGYNGCFYCLPRYDEDTLTSQVVLNNLEEDLSGK